MKKSYKHLAVLGSLCCVAALTVLWCSVINSDWLTLQEPQVDALELDKLGPYEEPKPHLIRAQFGLFKMCVNDSRKRYEDCVILDWYRFNFFKYDPTKRPLPVETELIVSCIDKLRFTLPFIGFSVIFTTTAFFCLIFGHFCQKNKKIIEASMLILAGLCQATALLTFVSQIGSEFEANLPYSHHQKRLITFYKYKYGFSFYLFLLSFSLSELAALFDMAAYFRKFPPNQYIISFHRQEEGSTYIPNAQSHTDHRNRVIPSVHFNHHTIPFQHRQESTYCTSLVKDPDLYNDFNGGIECNPDVGGNGGNMQSAQATHPDSHNITPLPPQSYISGEVTITKIDRNIAGLYGTIRNAKKTTNSKVMESFGTLKKENNI